MSFNKDWVIDIAKGTPNKRPLKTIMINKHAILISHIVKGSIIFLVLSGLIIFFAKATYDLYLNNPAFHMFIQSKGIFL